ALPVAGERDMNEVGVQQHPKIAGPPKLIAILLAEPQATRHLPECRLPLSRHWRCSRAAHAPIRGVVSVGTEAAHVLSTLIVWNEIARRYRPPALRNPGA